MNGLEQSFGGILVAAAAALAARPGTAQQLGPGATVPALTANDVNGRALSWDRWPGMAVIVIFHSENIVYSERGLRAIAKELSREKSLKDKAAVLLVTSGRRELGALTEILDKTGLPFAITVDPDRKNFAEYHVVAFPTVYLVGKDRKVVHVDKGFGPLLGLKVTAAAKWAAGLIDEKQFLAATTKTQTGPGKSDVLRLARTVRMVKQLLAAGMYEQARSSLERLVTKDTDYTEAVALLAKVYFLLGQPDRAAPWVKRVAELAPGSPALKLLEARAALAAHQADKALALTSTMDGKNPEVALLRGRAYELKGDFKQAAAAYRRALEAHAEPGR